MIKRILCVGLLLISSGCSTVDLSDSPSTSLKHQRALGELEAYGRQLLAQTVTRMDSEDKLKKSGQWEIVVVDEWASSLLRALTPIKQRRQKVQFLVGLKDPGIVMHYLEGKDVGDVLGLEKGKGYIVKKGEEAKKRGWSGYYLSAVRSYFLWPFTLRNSSLVAYSEEVEKDKRSYQKVFVSGGNIKANRKEDQFVVWVNKQTQLIDYIEFTDRRLWPAYRGVVAYSDYRETGGMLMPFEVRLFDTMEDKIYNHRFLVQDMNFR